MSDSLCAPSRLLCITSMNKSCFHPNLASDARWAVSVPKVHLWVFGNQSERLPSKQVKTSNQSHSESINVCQSTKGPLTLKRCIKIKWVLIGPFPTAPITAALHRDQSSLFQWKVVLAQRDGDQTEVKWSWETFLLWKDIIWGTYWIKDCISSQMRWLERLLFGTMFNARLGPAQCDGTSFLSECSSQDGYVG